MGTSLSACDENSDVERARGGGRGVGGGGLHSMPSFLPDCLWGWEWATLSTREQLVRGEGEGGACERGHFRIRCKNHAGPAFVKTVWVLFGLHCTYHWCSYMNHVREIALGTCKRTSGACLIWIICDSSKTAQWMNASQRGTFIKNLSFTAHPSCHIWLIVRGNVRHSNRLGNKIKLWLHRYLS